MGPIFVNLTPHSIHMPNGRQLPPCGYVARCAEETVPTGNIGGNPIVVRRYGKVENLPEVSGNTWYIVSHLSMLKIPVEALDALGLRARYDEMLVGEPAEPAEGDA